MDLQASEEAEEEPRPEAQLAKRDVEEVAAVGHKEQVVQRIMAHLVASVGGAAEEPSMAIVLWVEEQAETALS